MAPETPPLTVYHKRFGELDMAKLEREIGKAALAAPLMARHLGHNSMQATLETYVHPDPRWTPEEAAAFHYVTLLLRNDTKLMLKEWFPEALENRKRKKK